MRETVTTISRKVRKLLTFADPDVCRAAHLSDVLHFGAALFANSKGSADTYALSMAVRRIHSFISHNWVVGRFQKFLVLILHFNFWHAVAAAAVTLCVPFAVQHSVDLNRSQTTDWQTAVVCLTAGTFYVTLFFGHELGRLLCRRRGPAVFLDKVCIHQTDLERQRQGIEALSAFLRRSDNMVVCYTDLYLKKLWTMYELATYLALANQSPDSLCVHVVPVYYPMVVLGGVFTVLASSVAGCLLDGVGGQAAMTLVCLFLDGIGAAIIRAWCRQQRRMKEPVLAFRASEAHCFVEADRALVQGNIAMFMRECGLVAQGTPEPEAIAAFEEHVRQEVPDALARSVGRLGLAYKYILPLSLVYLSKNIFYLDHSGTQIWLLRLVGILSASFAAIPMLVAMELWLAKRCLGISAIAEFAYVIFITLAGVTVFEVCEPILGSLAPFGASSSVNKIYLLEEMSSAQIAGYLANCLVPAVITCVVFRPQWGKPAASKTPSVGLDSVASEGAPPALEPRRGGRQPQLRLCSPAGSNLE